MQTMLEIMLKERAQVEVGNSFNHILYLG